MSSPTVGGRTGYAAIGVSAKVRDVRFKVSPVLTVFDAVSCAEYRNVPAVLASHTLMSVTTSPFVPAHVAHDGVFDDAHDPADAAENVTDGRVVTDDALAVAAAPGSPVCSFTKLPAGAVDATARSM
jgi:hypothetical protein